MEKVRQPSLETITGSTAHLVAVATRKRVWERKKTKLISVLFPISTILLFIFIVLYAVSLETVRKLQNTELCTSKSCLNAASTLLDIMNTTADPCEDFYMFACGNFGQENPLPDGSNYLSWFEKGEHRLSKMIEAVVTEETTEDQATSTSLDKVRTFYQSCIATDTIENLGYQPLYDLLESVGLPRFPSKDSALLFNLGKTLGKLQRRLNLDLIVQVSFDRGQLREGQPNDTFILQVSPSIERQPSSLETSLWGVRRDPETFDTSPAMSLQKELEERLWFMANVMRLIHKDLGLEEGDGNTTDTLLTNAFKILSFKATLSQELGPLIEESFHKDQFMTFEMLQAAMDESSTTASSFASKIMWVDFVDELFGGEKGYWTYDYSQDMINVITVDTFMRLAYVLSSRQALTIQRYVWWTVVSEFARFTTNEMEMVYIKFHESMVGKGGGTYRERTCVGLVRKLFPLALPKEIRKVFGLTEEGTNKVKEMLNDIIEEFEVLVDTTNWLDRHTKDLNIEKAKAMKNIIGYNDAMLNDQQVDQFFENSENAEAIIFTCIDVPAGILQKPFYFGGLESLNYGGIGSILGHELTHGFDSEGRHYDHHGNIRQQIWSPEITDQFSQRATCFVHQYDKFNLTRHQRLNGEYTLAENIADNGGIRESYYAYQTHVRRHGPEPKLPGLQQFTPDQLLFISFASNWCETSTERHQELAAEDNHSPNRVRVIASLQNMKEFSQAFQCPVGSFMNPPTKCILW